MEADTCNLGTGHMAPEAHMPLDAGMALGGGLFLGSPWFLFLAAFLRSHGARHEWSC